MKTNKKTLQHIVLLTLVSVLFLMGGCKKDEPESDSTAQPAATTPRETQSIAQTQEPNTTQAVEKTIAQAMEQTTCPVMGGSIDQAVFTEYQGKKVYFCCQECLDKFKAEPEQYLAKLPQFKIQDPNAIKAL